MQQLSIFAQVYDTYKSKKPLRLIELFAGYGSQALALKYMGVPFEHYRVCEWNWKSNYAYALMHDLYQEYDTDITKDEIIKALQGKGLSADWNKPMEDTQISKMKEEDLRHAYNAIKSTRNTIDISKTHGSDLGIEPRRERERVPDDLFVSVPGPQPSRRKKWYGRRHGNTFLIAMASGENTQRA